MSMSPRRVKVAGDLFHGQVPPGAVYVGRAAPGLPASPYANPYPAKAHGLPEALRLYRQHLAQRPGIVAQARRELAGRNLACWCGLPSTGQPDPCHGAALLLAANYLAPAAKVLTVLHLADPTIPPVTKGPDLTDGVTACGQPMLTREHWVPVTKRGGDVVCGQCLEPGQEPETVGLW